MSNPEVPRPIDPLVLIDIDETLVNRVYQLSDSNIQETIEVAQESGWSIGLSSDTPYEAMCVWRDRLGLNGPIIAEKGSIVEHSGDLDHDQAEAKVFLKVRDDIEDLFSDIGVRVRTCNATEFIRDGNRLGSPGEKIVLINNLRTNSLSFYVRAVNQNGELVIDRSLTDELVDLARDLYPDIEGLAEDLNHNYGLLIVCPEGVSKRKGSIKLMGALGVQGFGMIGNSIADYVGSDIATHYAVHNATEEYKLVADYVATAPLTAGVDEILAGLIKKS